MAIWVESDLCDGCKLCLRACPYDAVELKSGKAEILDRCTSCGACLEVCRKEAVCTDAQPKSIPDFSDRKGVWVFAEQRQGRLTGVSLELLGKARELAQTLNEEVTALLLGDRVKNLADKLIQYGADNVHVAEHEILKDYRTLPYTDVIAEAVKNHKPNIFLMGASHIGRDLAPRVSRRIGAGLTADCTELTIGSDENLLLQTRPAFGGNVMATITNRYSRPQMATVRPGVMESRPGPRTKGNIIAHEVVLSDDGTGTRILDVIKEKKKGVDISRAKIIVAGGRGVGDAKGFSRLWELAEIMEAEVAGTRVTVEEGWIPPERQVGQTGRTVRPEIYIACGISGAIQHRAGMINSKYIIAINKDPRAPILQVANWGITGDLHEVIPEMIHQLKEAREKSTGV